MRRVGARAWRAAAVSTLLGGARGGLAAAPSPAAELERVRWLGEMRNVSVHRPPSAARDAPLLVVMGEAGRSARYAVESWHEVAALEGVVVVGVSSSRPSAWRSTSDGAGFVRAVVQQVGRRLGIDERRIYLFGAGSGGGFAVSVAVSQPRYFAAVASVDGDPGGAVPLGAGRLARPLPVRLFHSKRMLRFDVDALEQAAAALRRAGARVETSRLDLGSSFERKGRKVAGRIWAALGSESLDGPPRYERTPVDR